MVMGNPKNLHVYNFAILLKSRKFYAHKIYMFYSNLVRFCDIQDGPIKLDHFESL